MTYDKLKLPTAIIATLLPLSGAIAQNYDGQDLTGQTLNTTNSMNVTGGWSFIGTNLTNVTFAPQSGWLTISNVNFSNADFTGTTFTNVTFGEGINFSGSNLTYEQFTQGEITKAWNNINLSNMDLAEWRLGTASYSASNPGAGLSTNYTNLNIADSKINNATLYFSMTYSAAFKNALTSTKSWQDKDLSDVRIAGLGTIRNYDFTGFNLQNAAFHSHNGAYSFTCENFNFTSADMRGISLVFLSRTTSITNPTYKNTIQATGSVKDLNLTASGDLLHVREYRNKDGVAENLAAYISSSGTHNVGGGAKILIEMGRLNFTNNNGTTINFQGSDSEKAMLEFRYDTAEYKEFAQQGIDVGIGVNDSSKLTFLSDYEIAVELTGAVDVGDNFLLIDGETTGAITVAGAFTKGENITVKLNGNELNDDDWDIVFSNGDLSITMLTAVPEPAVCAALAGALSLALAAARRRKA